MTWTARELADRFGGRLIGSGEIRLARLGNLRNADPQTLSIIRDESWLSAWTESRAGAALVPAKVAERAGSLPDSGGRALIVVEEPDQVLVDLLEEMAPKSHRPEGVHDSAAIDPSATVEEGASIGPCAVIGPRSTIGRGCVVHAGVVVGAEVTVGEGCELHANTTVYDRCVLGRGVILHSGVVIGADGFGYIPAPDGRGVRKVPHIGNVVIEDGVEIGANSCVDRGKFGSTRIGAGTKIDNLVQIGHNCDVGRSCIICGCAALSGSVTLGDGVTLAGRVGIADNRIIGARATIAGGSGVMDDIPPGEYWGGYPARERRRAIAIIKSVEELPQVMRKVRRLLKQSESE